MNNASTPHETYSSSLCKGGNAFNISGNFRQLLVLYSLHVNGLKYSPINSVLLYVAVPVQSTFGACNLAG